MLESTEGYTSKNQLNYFAEGRNYNFKTTEVYNVF